MSDTRFRPVKGSEANIMAMGYNEGYVYFATDTKKIYMDAKGEEKIPMGGNSGIYYGKMILPETPDAGQKEFSFAITDIDGNEDLDRLLVPNINDLILNVPDGCFYRVTAIDGQGADIVITGYKLTIAGSGGGGGGGDSDNSNVGSVIMDRLTQQRVTTLYGSPYSIGFKLTATDSSGEPTGNGQYELYINNVSKEKGVAKQGDNYLEISNYLSVGSETTIRVVAHMDAGGSSTVPVSKTWYITATEMKLEWDQNYTQHYSTDEEFTLEWKVTGINIDKITNIIIDDIYTLPLITSRSSEIQRLRINPREYNLTHGAHKFELYASTYLDGKPEPDSTPRQTKNFIFAEPGNTSPILSVNLFQSDLTQYNTVSIPIILYASDNVLENATIILKEDGVEKDTWTNVANGVINEWAYTPTVPDGHILSVHCGTAEEVKVINVIKLDINNEEIGDYTFRFKANDFASNNAVQNWNSNGITATFSEKFDWINGGLKTENDDDGSKQMICIKAGSSMTINYPLFGNNAMTRGKTLKVIFKAANCRDYDATILSCKNDKQIISVDKELETMLLINNGTSLSYSQGVFISNNTIVLRNPDTLEFNPNVAECRAAMDSAFVLVEDKVYECHFAEVEKDYEEGEQKQYYAYWYPTFIEDSFEGLVLNAQSATLKSRSNSITTQYCEDTYIELEFDITKYDTNNVKNYIKFWIDGVPCGFTIYSSNDIFIDDNKNNITIGSPDCDVYLYMIKLYENGLSDDQHLENFIADAPNAEEMIKRYRRNDILNDDRRVIDPAKLAEANKDCLVHVYEIPRMTKTKKDKVFGCKYDQYHGSKDIILHAEGVVIKVQGTSSEKYVISAANIDSDFYNTSADNPYTATGFIDTATGKELKEVGWSMDGGTAIPCNFFCTKVNVASCENANNAMNQEWYNMFQPYKSVLRCKNKNARDTMQFTNGVLFIKDLNPTFKTGANDDKKNNNVFGEISGYISNNMSQSAYPRMYSLANMGNSKNNIHVFHDTENPKECCVEVADNQTDQQAMVNDNYNHADIGEKEKQFEFRYPDGVENASQEMIDGWNRLVSWMAHSNPQPKYEKHENITDEKKFRLISFNQKTNKDIPTFTLDSNKTAYTQISSFDPNITTYYTETKHIYGYTNLKLPSKVHFDAYTFRGFKTDLKNEKGELWQKDYQPAIAGCVVDTYVGDYEYDTYEYRMAKMLHECEDYLIMDSIIYHYLFIERHTMIDNVAKNTFWSTEDCMHWNMIKDYDNDTADGNDNNGKFTRTYGMETLDKLNANTYVFNAHESVWLNFIHGLKQACEHMYQKLEEKKVIYEGRELSAWSANDYLWLFNKWQSVIPERCWIEDYYRKYFRPYELYNDSMFISMMEGGQKKYQRKQYETYQETYMSSEYNGTDHRSSYMLVRSNGRNMLGYQLPVQVYSDCYIRMDTGSDTSVARVKRNQPAYFECPTDTLNNATMYFYPAKAFSVIGDINGGKLGEMLPEQVSFAQAGKLRELIVATADSTPNETLKEGFAVDNNILLEKLYVANLKSYTKDLDLSNCPNLVELDATGSTFTEINIANNAPVKMIKLNNPTGLSLSNLNELETLSINNYNRLSILKLNNIDKSQVNSRTLVEAAINAGALQNYKLTNIDWTLNKQSDVNSQDMEIVTLEYLLDNCKPLTSTVHASGYEPLAAALTGNILVKSNVYNYIDSAEIYDKYATSDRYPDLEINFEGSNAKLYTVDILDGNDSVCWTRKIQASNSIDETFLSKGPNGQFDPERIIKGSTASHTYVFYGEWEIYKTENMSLVKTIYWNDNRFPVDDMQITYDITLKPKFYPQIREYTLSFYGVNQQEPFYTTVQPYGTSFKDIQPSEIPYKEYTGNDLKADYNFVGYSLLPSSINTVPDSYKVQNEQSFYAVFEFVSDISTIVHPEWFAYEPYGYTRDKAYQDSGMIPRDDTYLQYTDSMSAWKIYPKVALRGKVTIPATYNGKPVVALGQFQKVAEQKITHLFFEKGSKVYEICNSAFSYDSNTGSEPMSTLQYVDFSQNTVRYIGGHAFSNCSSLDGSLLPNGLSKFTLSNKLFFIGEFALMAAVVSNTITEIQIPAEVVSMGQNAFAYQQIKAGSTLRIGSEALLSQLDLTKTATTLTNITKFVQNSDYDYKNIYFFSNRYGSADEIVHQDLKVRDAFFGDRNSDGEPSVTYPNTTLTVTNQKGGIV